MMFRSPHPDVFTSTDKTVHEGAAQNVDAPRAPPAIEQLAGRSRKPQTPQKRALIS
jgi:hypothetical protein